MGSGGLTASVFVAQIWKPPDIAQPNGISHTGQYELELITPLFAFAVFDCRTVFSFWFIGVDIC